METTNIVDFTCRDKMTDALTDLLRTGAQDLIARAVEAELKFVPVPGHWGTLPLSMKGA